jgi:metal-dependent amidase/aminoacylase/carboxypeptidase family protein
VLGGHNLICIGGIAAALGAVERLKEHPNLSAQVVLLGTPAEEGSGSSNRTILFLLTLITGGGGKYFLLEGGAFKNATASLMLHPGTDNVAFFSSAAIATCVVTYRGKPAHAAASPWEGANTLDALVLAHSAIGLLRQQLKPSDRVHGNITNGGQAVNIIPEYCTAMYGVRSPDPMRVKELMKKVENCFRGAAVATGTEVTINWTRTLDTGSGNKIAGLNVHSNAQMARRLQEYLSKDINNWAADAGILGNASTVSILPN